MMTTPLLFNILLNSLRVDESFFICSNTSRQAIKSKVAFLNGSFLFCFTKSTFFIPFSLQYLIARGSISIPYVVPNFFKTLIVEPGPQPKSNIFIFLFFVMLSKIFDNKILRPLYHQW